MKDFHIRIQLVSFCMLISTILFGQNVGINIEAPAGKLHVKGSEDVSQLIIDADTIQGNLNPLIKLRKSTGVDLLWLHSDDSTNVFLGLKSGRANVVGPQGVNNTFIGSRTGYSNTNGRDNTALGTAALFSNSKGGLNTAIGTYALYTQSYNPGLAWYQSNNVAIGYEALYSNQPTSTSNGVNNTAIGTYSLRFNTTGSQNTGNGMYSLFQNTKGVDNTANGWAALNSNTTASQNVAIGNKALFTQSYNNNGNVWSTANVAVGFEALFSNQPTNSGNGYRNTAVGYSALRSNSTGYNNTAIGYLAIFSNTSGEVNTAVGVEALSSNSTGSYNVALGNVALLNNVSGSFNTAIGGGALGSNVSGRFNAAVGIDALSLLIGGNSNCALGNNSGTAMGSPNVNNTVSIGNDGYANGASNQAFIGNLSTSWTGGQTTWFTYASDARVKNNVKEDVQGLDFINRLRPVTYHLDINAMRVITGNKETEDYPGKYDVEKIKQSGFLAQEVEQAAIASGYDFSGVTIPKQENELYTMSYAQFVVPLVKAVQEQQVEIDELKEVNKDLLARLEALEKKMQ